MADLRPLEECRLLRRTLVSIYTNSEGVVSYCYTAVETPTIDGLHSNADWAFNISRCCERKWIYATIFGHGVSNC